MNKHLKSILAAGVLAVVSVSFSACNSENQQSGTATDGHAAHQSAADNKSVAVEVPDYSAENATLKEPLREVYGQYLQIKDALVAGSSEQAKKAAQGVTSALDKMDATTLSGEQKSFYENHKQMIRQHAQAIAGSNDIAAQRGQLDMLSESTFALVKAFDANEGELYYQHCPMANNDKGGYWISQTSEIKNPYFGEKMLKCGETKEVLN